MYASEFRESFLREQFLGKVPPWWTSLCLAASLIGPGTAAAQTPAPPSTPLGAGASAPAETQAALTKGEIKAMREFRMLDFNGDGKLSRTEVKLFPRLANAFDDADTDRDGYVSYEEVREFAARYRAERDRNKAAQAAISPASAPQ